MQIIIITIIIILDILPLLWTLVGAQRTASWLHLFAGVFCVRGGTSNCKGFDNAYQITMI
jgi:nitrate/nitrite transporter NarK